MKKLIAMLLAVVMVLSLFAGCGNTAAPSNTGDKTQGNTQPSGTDTTTEPEATEAAEPATYTYHAYSTSIGNNWNPHTWETSADDSIQSYLTSPFCTMQALDTENGVYQWIWEMATGVKDVTAENQADLTTYKVNLPEGKSASEVTEGYVYEIALNPNAVWANGEAINADTYIYSMKAMLDPAMKNYRANLYYAGESAVAGGAAYYYAGDIAYLDNGANAGYAVADLVKADDGAYYTPDGEPVYVATRDALAWTSGYSIGDYVDAYGEAYFGMDAWNALQEIVDENGRAALTDESLELMIGVITAVDAWGESDADVINYLVYTKSYPECEYEGTVGCYKVDDYTIRYICESYLDYNYFLTSLTSNWIVYKDLYEGGKDTSGELVTTNYGTSIDTFMPYGPYIMTSLQADKQIVFEQNPTWYGYETLEDGSLYSETPYEVDGQHIQRYQTTKIVIDVMTDDAAKLAFMKGELDTWTPNAEELVTYSTSEQLYKVDETYTMSWFFNTGVDNLKAMDESKGNTNSVVLSNVNFRKAFSLAIDRQEYVSATAGYKPAYSLLNSLYYYDVYNDPTSQYRNTEQAMQAICNVYGVEYGEGTPYATLKDAYNSINGYNLTEAKELMKVALAELVADGLYTAGDPIHIRIGFKKGALDSTDNQVMELMNKYINAAASEAGFGTITLEAVGNINDRYGDTAKGEYAIGYGAWGGAAFYPFRNMQVYCDTEQYSIHEAGCWDPSVTELTLNINGEDVTMTWQDWSRSCVGTGAYSTADFDTKLDILSGMEEAYLQLYYRIPLAGTTACELLGYKINYYTEDYNIMYGFGGIELMNYNYTDAEWAEYVASQNGALNYE